MSVHKHKHGKTSEEAKKKVKAFLKSEGYDGHVSWNGDEFSASVGFSVVLRSVERAELACRDADVGVVDVSRDDVGHLAAGVQREPPKVRGIAEVLEAGLGLEPHALFEREPAALGAAGIRVDFRPRDGDRRWLRVSGNSAGFAYELEAVIAAIAHER